MSFESLLKIILIFAGGALIVGGFFYFFGGQPKANIIGSTKERIFSQETPHIQEPGPNPRSFIKPISDKVLPALTKNPIIEPLLQTKKEVEETVETVRSLPEEQKNAICKQICQ